MNFTRRGIVVILACAFAGASARAQDSGPVPVTVVQARTVKMAPKMAVPGSVVSRYDSHVASEVEGNVVWVAEVGDEVKAGDVVARLDDHVMKMQVDSDAADVARLNATLHYDQLQAARMERLARDNAIATSDRDSAISTRDVDKAQLAQSQASLEKSKYDLDHSQIRAPFPGRVAARLINPGEYASVGTAVVRLVDIQDIEVSAPAPIVAARYISPGSPVTVIVEGKPVVTKVRAIVPVGDVNSRTVEVRLSIAPSDGIVGDAVKVLLPSAPPRNVLAVPRDALVLREDNTYVFRISKQGLAERIAVETGSEEGDLVEVEGDLSAGDRVVTKGAERLEPGQRVRATQAS